MEKKKLSKEKAEEILRELELHKERKNVKIKFAADEDTEDIVGNVSACTDCGDDSGTEGGVGDDSACAGNYTACVDYDDDNITGNYSACADSVCHE